MESQLTDSIVLLTREEVAAMLRINTRTLDKNITGKVLQSFKIGRTVRFKKTDVLKFIESCKV